MNIFIHSFVIWMPMNFFCLAGISRNKLERFSMVITKHSRRNYLTSRYGSCPPLSDRSIDYSLWKIRISWLQKQREEEDVHFTVPAGKRLKKQRRQRRRNTFKGELQWHSSSYCNSQRSTVVWSYPERPPWLVISPNDSATSSIEPVVGNTQVFGNILCPNHDRCHHIE